ncbi:MAG: hypothetical protein V4653_14360 [Pseudomonadota bacterium]
MTIDSPLADPPGLRRVTLHLARSAGFPNGSDMHGYEILMPLDEQGHLDPAILHGRPHRCRVHRFWAGEPDRIAWLSHRPGGVGGAHWVIDYDERRADDDEDGYRFDTHAFIPGEYVTIRHGREEHTFRVAAVEEVPALD